MKAAARANGWHDDGLGHYLRSIRRYDMLSLEDEQSLARRWRDNKDSDAADKLVTSHLRLVVKIAMGYRGYGLPLADLVAEGNVGMVRALDRFDPDRGFRLATYAMWWIRAAINEYVVRSRSLVKIGTTAAQKKLFFNLSKVKHRLHANDDSDLAPETVREIARLLSVPEADVVLMNQRMSGPDNSLNVLPKEGGDSEWQDRLVDPSANQETKLAEREELEQRSKLLAQSMVHLNDRERHILKRRWLTEKSETLETLSRHFGVSRERVRQIETRAFEKLRKAMRGEAGQTRTQIRARRRPAARRASRQEPVLVFAD